MSLSSQDVKFLLHQSALAPSYLIRERLLLSRALVDHLSQVKVLFFPRIASLEALLDSDLASGRYVDGGAN